ncbi:Hydrogenase-4 component B (plasmid) [Sinorhizobium sojae CCBAU 05684]|uniref:Hydrogenase-4 component B n=1 Tax=Sinorhizobium sojae CCBAU 05684 TaxID=716928 RepID=A0A249PJP6_9HYPH|nr:proton-conducting transporter membrane subunit [Sinorhizobium sojae]ASY66026.1 Hydrogenase-4 component B [Sinorhizobium sojae CCBAU 05684]
MSGASLLLCAAPGFPLALMLLALLPGTRRSAFALMPAAPLPALAAALLVPAGTAQPLTHVLLGAGLALDETNRVFLGIAALLWSLAGLFACSAIDETGRNRFTGFWLTTLTGNLLLYVAADIISLYLSFAVLSLAAFGLVVHSGSAEALRAGRIYLLLAILGETSLFLALLIGADAAGSLLIEEFRAAILQSPHRDLAFALLVTGFGLKAGLVPLHVWLPLAHPVAPVPASAVLSGAIVNAGIFGFIQFLPLTADLPIWSDVLVGLGIATAYIGVVVGVFQNRPKTVLAYSTLSQMGLVVVVLGSAFGSSGADAVAIAASTLYVAHHSLAKGALFLSVGVIAETGRKNLLSVMLLAGLLALAIAGLPLTGGALAKLAIKAPIGEGTLALLVTLSAVGTTLLMLRFLQLVRRTAPESGRARNGLLVPFFACTGAALAAPWLVFPALTELTISYAFDPENIWAALWPILAGASLLGAVLRLPLRPSLAIPEGDIVIPLERSASAICKWAARLEHARMPEIELSWLSRPARLIELMERRLANWRLAGTLLIVMIGFWLVWAFGLIVKL